SGLVLGGTSLVRVRLDITKFIKIHYYIPADYGGTGELAELYPPLPSCHRIQQILTMSQL
ncbi:MAG: hypothetical protein ACRD8W_30180, partial [Nitrososphaeraceae archaeon]